MAKENWARGIQHAIDLENEIAKGRKIIDTVSISHETEKDDKHQVYVQSVEVDDIKCAITIIAKDLWSDILFEQKFECRGNGFKADSEAIYEVCRIADMKIPSREQLLDNEMFSEIWKELKWRIEKIESNEYLLVHLFRLEYDAMMKKNTRIRFKSVYFPEITYYVTEEEYQSLLEEAKDAAKTGGPKTLSVIDHKSGQLMPLIINHGKKDENVLRCGTTKLPVVFAVRMTPMLGLSDK